MRRIGIFKNFTLIIITVLTFKMQVQAQLKIDSSLKSAAELTERALQNYGPDDLLYRGLLYIPDHPKAENNPYFTENDWNKGAVTLAGEVYTGLDLKYNVNLNLIILKMQNNSSDAHQPVILGNDLIDSFTIGDVTFANLSRLDTTGKLAGFGQLIFNKDFIFYKSYSKEFLNQYSQSNPYGFYSKMNATYFLFRNGIKTKIGSKRALVNYFNPIKKPLKKYIRKEDFKFKTASKQEFYQLLNFCEKQMSFISD